VTVQTELFGVVADAVADGEGVAVAVDAARLAEEKESFASWATVTLQDAPDVNPNDLDMSLVIDMLM